MIKAGTGVPGYCFSAGTAGDPTEKGSKNGGSFSAPIATGERLYQDFLQAAAGVVVGHNDQAEILMIIRPECSYCKSTWKELRDSVFANKVQVRLIPVSSLLGSDEARMAGRLLQAEKPLETWDKFVSGDNSVLAGDPGSFTEECHNGQPSIN